jgi:tRNA isopentenyl-2-thiomethyl-A-37 hydroxylase MiaE
LLSFITHYIYPCDRTGRRSSFHIGNNVKAKCITDCRVKAKPTDAKVVEKEVKEAKEDKHYDLVKKIMRVWKEVVESPTEDSYASALLKFKEVCEPFPKFLAYVETTVLNTI